MKAKRLKIGLISSLLAFAGILSAQPLQAVLRGEVLATTRLVKEKDWLSLKLAVLGLQLSYPAYRIHLELDDQNIVVFRFLASSGLAEHLTEQLEREAAEQMMTYHARGIREQLEQLLREQFSDLWSGYDAQKDLKGTFMGPGEAWDDPPRTIAVWETERLSWRFGR